MAVLAGLWKAGPACGERPVMHVACMWQPACCLVSRMESACAVDLRSLVVRVEMRACKLHGRFSLCVKPTA
jgi:hypothetical protein